jgi:hypothetical protein
VGWPATLVAVEFAVQKVTGALVEDNFLPGSG